MREPSVGIIIPSLVGTKDYEGFQIPDEPESDLSQFFDSSIAFIEKHLSEERKVLVHCLEGISRSTTIVAAHLIRNSLAFAERKHKISDAEAIKMIEEKRSIINPNPGFREQLRNFYLLRTLTNHEYDDLELID